MTLTLHLHKSVAPPQPASNNGGPRGLGWVAGEMAITDPVVSFWVEANAHCLDTSASPRGALFVVTIGKWLGAKKAHTTEPVTSANSAAAGNDAARNTGPADQRSTESYAGDANNAAARSSRH